MADITKVSVNLDASTAMFAQQITGLYAGEDLAAGDACYINPDGLVYLAQADAAATAGVAGFTARAVDQDEPVTLFGPAARYAYGSALTPGAILYLSAVTPGALADAPNLGDVEGIALVVNATDIIITRASGFSELASSF